MGCWDDVLIDLLSISERFLDRKSLQNQSKINPKTYRKQDASWDGFWIALGSIFRRFWGQVGGQVGAKLAPKSKDMGTKTMSKNHQKSGHAVVRSGTQVVRR